MLNDHDNDFSHSIQNYLKIIYEQTRNGEPATTLGLATALNIRSPSVTNMLQKLAKNYPDLVIYRRHYGILLTTEGEKKALQIIRRHRLIEEFLFRVLNYPLEKIHPEAEELEHAVSSFFVERIANLLKDPSFDPHGHPIPDRDLKMAETRNLRLLSELKPGQSGVTRLISDQEPELLVFLEEIRLLPGKRIKIVQLNPIDGTQQVEVIETRQKYVLGHNISGRIHVEVA